MDSSHFWMVDWEAGVTYYCQKTFLHSVGPLKHPNKWSHFLKMMQFLQTSLSLSAPPKWKCLFPLSSKKETGTVCSRKEIKRFPPEFTQRLRFLAQRLGDSVECWCIMGSSGFKVSLPQDWKYIQMTQWSIRENLTFCERENKRNVRTSLVVCY